MMDKQFWPQHLVPAERGWRARILATWLVILPAALGCGQQSSGPAMAHELQVPATTAPAPEGATKATSIYVPVYSSVFAGEGRQALDLSISLFVRNSDPRQALRIRRVQFFDRSGALVHDYLRSPQLLGPLASAEAAVTESDTRAGYGGSFGVDIELGASARPPVVEAVMVGTRAGVGISFLAAGRVVE